MRPAIRFMTSPSRCQVPWTPINRDRSRGARCCSRMAANNLAGKNAAELLGDVRSAKLELVRMMGAPRFGM